MGGMLETMGTEWEKNGRELLKHPKCSDWFSDSFDCEMK
jgi:hypothetical protein